MAAEDEELLPLRPIHRSLERRIMLKGGERELVMVAFILGILVGVVDSVGFGPWIGVPAGIGVTVGALWVARAMGKADKFMSRIAARSLKYRKSYSARGRPTAIVPTVKSYR